MCSTENVVGKGRPRPWNYMLCWSCGGGEEKESLGREGEATGKDEWDTTDGGGGGGGGGVGKDE